MPAAPWHHCTRIWSFRSSGVPELPASSPGRPRRRPRGPATSSSRARAPRRHPGATRGRCPRAREPGRGSCAPRPRTAAGSKGRPRPVANEASALSCHASSQRPSSVQPCIRCAATRVPGEPHISSSASFARFARTPSSRRSASSTLGASRHERSRSPGLSAEERGLGGSRHGAPGQVIRPLPLELEGSTGGGREIDASLGLPPPTERVQRPHDAGRAAVEILQGRRRPVGVCFGGRPEPDRIERHGDDRADRRADAPLIPGLVRQRLERLRPVEHYATAEAGASRGRRRETIWETPSPPIVTP